MNRKFKTTRGRQRQRHGLLSSEYFERQSRISNESIRRSLTGLVSNESFERQSRISDENNKRPRPGLVSSEYFERQSRISDENNRRSLTGSVSSEYVERQSRISDENHKRPSPGSSSSEYFERQSRISDENNKRPRPGLASSEYFERQSRTSDENHKRPRSDLVSSKYFEKQSRISDENHKVPFTAGDQPAIVAPVEEHKPPVMYAVGYKKWYTDSGFPRFAVIKEELIIPPPTHLFAKPLLRNTRMILSNSTYTPLYSQNKKCDISMLDRSCMSKILEEILVRENEQVNPYLVAGMMINGARSETRNDMGIVDFPNVDLAVLRVNRSWNQLGSQVFYNNHVFHFTNPLACDWWLKRIGMSNLTNVRSLVLYMCSGWDNTRDHPEHETSRAPSDLPAERLWVRVIKYLAPTHRLKSLTVCLIDWESLNINTTDVQYSYLEYEPMSASMRVELHNWRQQLLYTIMAGIRGLYTARIDTVTCDVMMRDQVDQIEILMCQPRKTATVRFPLPSENVRPPVTVDMALEYVRENNRRSLQGY